MRGVSLARSNDWGVELRWRWLESSTERSTLSDLPPETRGWLDRTGRLRWEEVVEILDLSAEENRSFRELEVPNHPLADLRAAFVRDKRVVNLALYLLGTRRPLALGLELQLPGAYEERAVRFARELLSTTALPAGILPERSPEHRPRARPERMDDSSGIPKPSLAGAPPEIREGARRRFFAWRLLASAGRIYGRCDRVFQSLASGGGDGPLLVLDGRDSSDPFVVVFSPNSTGTPPDQRGTWLEERLLCPGLESWSTVTEPRGACAFEPAEIGS